MKSPLVGATDVYGASVSSPPNDPISVPAPVHPATAIVYPGALALTAAAGMYASASAWPPKEVFAAMAAAGLLLALVVQLALPYRMPAGAWWRKAPNDIVHTFLSNMLPGSAMEALLVGGLFAASTRITALLGTAPWPTDQPWVLQFALALLLVELVYYVMHRLLHRVDAFWHFHAVHHSATELYLFASSRHHLVSVTINRAAQFCALGLLGVPSEVTAPLSGMILANSWLQHCDVRLETRWLDGLLVTPAVHHFHHHRDYDLSNTNFGGALVLWDRVFGTFHRPQGELPASYGFEGIRENYVVQLAYPFRTLIAGSTDSAPLPPAPEG
ncbi:MAG: sterol desaturase family protein [Sandaracinaceae bacterium]|nr:sterol desaturase family protein [Sandaracinaceae bacterium]